MIIGTTKVLHSFDCVVGGFGSFGVDGQPPCASVVEYYRYRVGVKIGIFLFTVNAFPVLDEVVSSYLFTKLYGGFLSSVIWCEFHYFLLFCLRCILAF